MTQTSPSDGVAWIAGVGASAGLGAALARRYAQGGLTVAITGRNAEKLKAVAAEIERAGGRAVVLVGDVSVEPAAQRLAAEVAEIGPLRAAAFNAASMMRGNALDISVADFEAAWRGGTLAGFVFSREVVRLLKANAVGADATTGIGSLVFTGATASVRGGAKFAGFAAAKAGLRSLAQSLAREYGPQGIHVAHVVVDGGIDGERLRSSSPQRAADAGTDGLLDPAAIAETYWQLHLQPRSAWSFEVDLRPFKETF